ncbi:ATP-binding cassette domain-containing protein [bacterium]|nr:MAG: ATP-binding cassette domain-containing protein [bacterium]
MNAVEFTDIWEKYRLKFSVNGKAVWEELWALKEINFSVQKGEVFGVIGQNGAGKTTLLKLIAGMLMPDRGEVKVSGRVSTLMELGAGFNPEFTGKENIVINSRIYGISEGEVLEQKIAEIVAFSGLGKFINAPMKYYSQGMYARLAFGLAIYVDPDILLIDDVLAVGDEEAQRNCNKKIFELKGSGKTIIIVSHDMRMINKLCDRAILLDKGSIKKSGAASMVVPYYLDMVGDKNGIAVLESGGLRAVFNNGRLSFSCANDFITKGEGGYFSFFDRSINNRVPSFNLTWQIKSVLSDRIIAEGVSYDGAFSQVWQLRLEDNCLEWLVETKGRSPKDPNLNFALPSQFNKWVTLSENGSFPAFIYKIKWQELGQNNFPEGVLGVISDPPNGGLPALIFEAPGEDSMLKVFNSGFDEDSRVVQAGALENGSIRMNIRVFASHDDFNVFMGKKKESFFLKQEEERQRVLAEEQRERQRVLAEEQRERQRVLAESNITSGALTLFVDGGTKSLKILTKKGELTKGRGLFSVFFTQKKWFYPHDGTWQLERVSSAELKLTIDYQPLNLKMFWNVTASVKDELDFKIEMEIGDGAVIVNQDLILEFSDSFISWQTENEEGAFAAGRYVNDVAPIRLKDSKTNRIILRSRADNPCRLFFGLIPGLKKHIISIFKRRINELEFSTVNFSSIIAKGDQAFRPGKYTVFEGKIGFGEEIKLEKTDTSAGNISLKRGQLELIFDQGKARLFFKNKELTSGLSMFSSLRSSGFWLDSYQAVWDICSKKGDKITVHGHWPNIPVSQKWQLELSDKNTINWKINMDIFGELDLDLAQVNIMLSPGYKSWEVPGVNSGRFLDEYTDNYDILPFRFWYGPAGPEGMEVRGSLPGVSFKSLLDNEGFRKIIENSDYIYGARLIQYQKSKFNALTLDSRLFFEGLIQINE